MVKGSLVPRRRSGARQQEQQEATQKKVLDVLGSPDGGNLTAMLGEMNRRAAGTDERQTAYELAHLDAVRRVHERIDEVKAAVRQVREDHGERIERLEGVRSNA